MSTSIKHQTPFADAWTYACACGGHHPHCPAWTCAWAHGDSCLRTLSCACGGCVAAPSSFRAPAAPAARMSRPCSPQQRPPPPQAPQAHANWGPCWTPSCACVCAWAGGPDLSAAGGHDGCAPGAPGHRHLLAVACPAAPCPPCDDDMTCVVSHTWASARLAGTLNGPVHAWGCPCPCADKHRQTN